MGGIDWTKCSLWCYDPDTDKDKLMKEKLLTCPMVEHDEWNVWMWTNLLIRISLITSTGVMPVSNGGILIMAICENVMRCNPEERRTSCSRYSIECIGVRECTYIKWEEFRIFFDRSRMTWTIQSLHNYRWLNPWEAPRDGQRLHLTTRSPSATSLDLP